MQIRLCTKNDIPSTAAFYDETVKYLTEHINYPKWRYKDYPSQASVDEAVREESQFICFKDGEIVGAFIFNTDPNGAYENTPWEVEAENGEFAVCHTLAVKPSCQGCGIGKAMVMYCLDYARKHGYKAVRLDVVPDNIPARKLYEKCGFIYRGDIDLERNIPDIPLFSMYELAIA